MDIVYFHSIKGWLGQIQTLTFQEVTEEISGDTEPDAAFRALLAAVEAFEEASSVVASRLPWCYLQSASTRAHL